MNISLIRTLVVSGMVATPLFAFAQTAFDNLIDTVSGGLNTIIIFLFLVATVIFLFGVVKYISAAGDEEKTKEARQMIIWGVIFLAVMVAVWGFVEIVLDFIFNDEGAFDIPGSGDVPTQPQ
ncbi:MAG: hypothetical protein A3J54_03435 [Candidatus Ryanbacteria bacterium RIFCSPHIGHO2_02_FULL_45_13b]|uniref:Uncharacterized protein n=1 Tax=Candidatus Ryanbacteria bacterium RIFCSPHIGHO2_02_FULL_45_13b TaxID=1802117 RepID=A0A1G2GBM3_9BACT|nr:MAG: hypothetical protein A3J54_03435 [Candidatus Ryanbacteria bacterium RIFCSPHIGHO2_02_FULL_45_13b]